MKKIVQKRLKVWNMTLFGYTNANLNSSNSAYKDIITQYPFLVNKLCERYIRQSIDE